jgi:hypothetical protein
VAEGISLDTSGAEQTYTWQEAHENRVLILMEKALALSLIATLAEKGTTVDPAEVATETAELKAATNSLDDKVASAGGAPT